MADVRKRLSTGRIDHTEPYRRVKPIAYDNGDRTIHGPMHFQPTRDLAGGLNARLKQVASDDSDRKSLLEMLLLRPRKRQLTDIERARMLAGEDPC